MPGLRKGGNLSLEFREQVHVSVCLAEGKAEERAGGRGVGRPGSSQCTCVNGIGLELQHHADAKAMD